MEIIKPEGEEPVLDSKQRALLSNAKRVQDEALVNQEKLRESEDLNVDEIIALNKRQNDLNNAAAWLQNLVVYYYPPKIVHPPPDFRERSRRFVKNINNKPN